MITPAVIRDRTGRKSLREVISTAPTHLQRHNRPALYRAGTSGAFRLNPWLIEPSLGRISAGGVERVVEPKTMEVLVHLAARAGEVTSSDELIDSVWRGRPMGDNPVHKCISQLRSALGDDARRPRYIDTIPKRGYRLLPRVERLEPIPVHSPGATPIRVCIDIWPPQCVSTSSELESQRAECPAADRVVQGATPKLQVTIGAAEDGEGSPHRDAAIDLDMQSVRDIVRQLALAMSAALR